MSLDAVLLESPTMRARVAERVEVLDRVKALALLPDGVHVTTEGVAAYFGVEEMAIRCMVSDHRAELTSNGYAVVTGAQLSVLKTLCGIRTRARSLALFNRRTVLNVAMLLRDSETARQVRCYLLDVEETSRRGPVDNPVGRPVDNFSESYPQGSVDAAVVRVAEQAVRSVITTAVTPLLNVLVDEVGVLGRKVDRVADRVDRLERIVLEGGERPAARRRPGQARRLGRGDARRPMGTSDGSPA